MRLAPALGVFAVTLFLVIARPRGLNVAVGAAVGAALALGLGLVSAADLLTVWGATWNATFTLIALIVLSLLLDAAGLFRFLALHLARGAGLIRTPIALELCALLGFARPAALAVMFATGFIVDAASLPLVTSNLTNIISADLFGQNFGEYASVMLPVNAAAVAASLGVLWGVFRRALPPCYDAAALPAPASALRDPLTCGVGAGLMGLLLLGFFLAPALELPVSAVALVAAAALLLTALAGRRLTVGPVLRGAPWDVVVFSLGMYLVVYALHNAGLTRSLAGLLTALAPQGPAAVAFGTGGLLTALSAGANNLPAVLTGALGIQAAAVPPETRELMVYANVIAADIGAKLTPIGSLATLLWLGLLGRRGLHVSWGEYLRLGVLVTLPVLAASLAALVLRLG